ncbi:ATPase AAA [Bifidobacterium catenulatum DSM 16992 = JCM 1194 = LMG 11043]|nr:ATPase AAA [Bifidobacterium catenulatum DSM 16992 = JCM 1194 = LMG 11043]
MIRDLRVYLESMGGANRIAYYRDEKGLEVDVILELVDGRWAAVEIKLSDLKSHGEKMWTNYMLSKKKVCGNPLSQVREPEFMTFIVGRGDIAYRRDDGILVLPIATLGA